MPWKGLGRNGRGLEELEASRDLSQASQESWEGVSEKIINWVYLCTKPPQIVMAEAGLAN